MLPRHLASVLAACILVGPLVACRPERAQPTIEPSGAAVPTTAVPSSLAEILAGLVPIAPGGDAIAITAGGAAIDACEAAGWPESLPPATAAALATTATGSHATVVHPGGTTQVTIASIGCQAPGDIEDALAWLYLVAPPPAGPGEAELPEALRGLVGRHHLAILGATVASTATLREPPTVDLRTAAPVRARLVAHVESIAAANHAHCKDADPELVPAPVASAAAVPAAVDAAAVHPVRRGDATLVFAVINDAAITFDCYGQSSDVAVLLDGDGQVLFEAEANNGISLQWLVDLDGDGTDEALLDIKYLEDGGHRIELLHGDDAAWDGALLWAAASP